MKYFKRVGFGALAAVRPILLCFAVHIEKISETEKSAKKVLEQLLLVQQCKCRWLCEI
jgi:hypothetical protein